jgi:hypothetical protein
LRTYKVPPANQDELRGVLETVVATPVEGDTRLGRVTDGPGGTLLVVAPPRIQGGIEEIVAAGFDAPIVPNSVRLTYWFLVGRPLALSRGTQPFSIAGGTSLPQLEPVLSQIAAAQGPTEFSLLDTVALTSMAGRPAQVQGRFFQVAQTATTRSGRIIADIHVTPPPGRDGNRVSSRVMLEQGQYLVLGQAGFTGNPLDAFSDAGREDRTTLYCVITADLDR